MELGLGDTETAAQTNDQSAGRRGGEGAPGKAAEGGGGAGG